MSPIAVPMVPQGGRVLVAEWWEVTYANRRIRLDVCPTKDEREGIGFKQVVHVRRYRLNGKVK